MKLIVGKIRSYCTSQRRGHLLALHDQFDNTACNWRMPKNPVDLYKVLDVPSSASFDDIKSSFLKKAKETHPDKETGSAEQFQIVNNAYEVLSDPVKRATYNRESGVTHTGIVVLQDMCIEIKGTVPVVIFIKRIPQVGPSTTLNMVQVGSRQSTTLEGSI